jgi:hypothetical protein
VNVLGFARVLVCACGGTTQRGWMSDMSCIVSGVFLGSRV